MLLSGDFKQILLVIPQLWDNVEVKHLQTNMRVYLCGDQAAGQFAEQLLAIGDGKFPTEDDTIDIVQPLETIGMLVSSIDEMMSRIYPDLLPNFKNCL